MNEKQLVNIIRYSPIIVLPFFIILTFYLEALNYKKSFQDNYNQMTNYLLEKEKKVLEKNAAIALEIIEYQKSIHNSDFLELLKNINKKTNDYFFIFDKNGKVVLHSYKPILEGKNLLSSNNGFYKDATRKIILENNYSKFIEYYWENPKTEIFEKKISFIKEVPNSNLIIGSGFYPSDIEIISENQKNIIIKEYEDRLNHSILLATILFVLSVFLAKFISNKLLIAFENLNYSIKKKNDELDDFNKNLDEKVSNRTQKLQEDYTKMKNIASIDNLTKIYNRYAFFKEFDKLEKHKFSLIMFDIDHFKKVNDTYGHDVGDFILYELCRVVENRLRGDDIFGRVGGEEFMILLPSTPVINATLIANRIKNDVENHDFKKVPKVTISLGVIESSEVTNSEQILKNVDIALYKAKNAGRNKVVVYEE